MTAVEYAAMPPRHFWRRFLAYLIDAWLFGLILGLPLMIATTVIYGPILPTAGQDQCQEQAAPADVIQAMKLAPTANVSITSCPMSDLLHGDRETIFAVGLDDTAPSGQLPRFAFFTRDTSGLHPLNYMARFLWPEVIVWVLIPVAFAIMSANGRRTLGKKAVGLIVRRTDDGAPPFAQALARECWKLLPATVLSIVMAVVMIDVESFAFGLVQSFLAGDYQPLIILLEWAFGLEGVLLVWWLGPFVVWRGQSWHDRLAGTKVVRK